MQVGFDIMDGSRDGREMQAGKKVKSEKK